MLLSMKTSSTLAAMSMQTAITVPLNTVDVHVRDILPFFWWLLKDLQVGQFVPATEEKVYPYTYTSDSYLLPNRDNNFQSIPISEFQIGIDGDMLYIQGAKNTQPLLFLFFWAYTLYVAQKSIGQTFGSTFNNIGLFNGAYFLDISHPHSILLDSKVPPRVSRYKAVYQSPTHYVLDVDTGLGSGNVTSITLMGTPYASAQQDTFRVHLDDILSIHDLQAGASPVLFFSAAVELAGLDDYPTTDDFRFRKKVPVEQTFGTISLVGDARFRFNTSDVSPIFSIGEQKLINITDNLTKISPLYWLRIQHATGLPGKIALPYVVTATPQTIL